jgi:long-chain acyl-CoA synthetase
MWQIFMNYLDLGKYDLSSLKFCSYSTAPMPAALIKRLMEKFPGITFFSTYGLTEAASSLTILPNDQHILEGPEFLTRRLGSLGRPIDGVDVRIVDEKGQDCPPGVVGEIIGRGDNIMKGYWNLPEETEKTLKGGWLYTGDLGYWDEYGYIYMADRKKDMIISGGENIYPREVEDVIREIKGVIDVAVIGVPDEKWGEAVTAIVMKEPACNVSGEDIIQHCAKNIASYKKPKMVEFVGDLPRNPTGKVLKKVLREKYWRGRERKV